LAVASGARCIAPAYRLAPEHPFPAALDDALACYRELLRSTPPEQLFLAGDSAGGGLCLALMLRLRDAGEPLPRAAVLLSPWVDLTLDVDGLAGEGAHDYLPLEQTARNALGYCGAFSPTHPWISPVYGDLHGLPPWLVQTGEWELLREQNVRLVARARAAGVEVIHELSAGMLHAYPCFASVSPQGIQALVNAGEFIRSRAQLERLRIAG
jgi:acetyl esterase/lipase